MTNADQPALKKTYICEMCGNEYEFGWTEVEAREEAEQNFPDMGDSDSAIICDACYKKLGLVTPT